MEKLIDYIKIYDTIISDKITKKIINAYRDKNLWRYSAIADGRIDKTIRNVKGAFLSNIENINSNPKFKEIDDIIFECTNKIIKKYQEDFPYCIINQDSGYDLLRYTKGQFYRAHTDADTNYHRTVSCSICLNDNYEGGEWSFFDGQFITKPPKGSAILFPSNFLYPHEIKPITSGTRYSIVTWFR